MPYQTSWYLNQRVVMTRVSGEYRLEELQDCIRTALELIRQGQAPVHHIVDLREISNYPGTVREFIQEIRVVNAEPRLGWTIMLTNNQLARFFGAIASKVGNQPFSAVPDLSAANKTLLKIEPGLAHLLSETDKNNTSSV
jgi:hypothetical protein